MTKPWQIAAALLLALATLAAPTLAQTGDRPVDRALVALDGTRVDLADGSAVTEIVVVAAWCPPCERAVTEARRRLGPLRRQGYRVVLVGVSRRQSAEQFSAWAEKQGFGGPLVHDADGELERLLGARLLPWHVVTGRDGKVLHRGDEAPDAERLRAWSTR